ncbi:hypothetical protein [Pseudophaeobacter sp.]|uniref:hypothetical protein n=1 Tax=Pseudophaeobacter sp. TaxID=1971739 RepID=UPI0040589DA0
MNKLNDMIATAAKLVAQNPNAGEILDWNSRALSQAVSNWYEENIPLDGSCLLIDVSDQSLQLRPEGQGDTNVIYTQRPLPDAADQPEAWRVSQRVASDLQNRDVDLLQRIRSATSVLALQQALIAPADAEPWIADDSLQTVVAPFLLNTMQGPAREMALAEMSRVLIRGGSVETLVLATDEPLSEAQITCQGHSCSAFPQESDLAGILLATGFHGISLRPLLERPYMIVNGVELRAFALRAHTGTKGVCLEQGDAAIYLGPWAEVQDDDGHSYPRGIRMAVCAKTAAVLQRPPYAGSFEIIQAYDRPPLDKAAVFDCSRDVRRPVAETKGRVVAAAPPPDSACAGEDCGC